MTVVLAAASKTAMRPLRLEDLFTVAAVPTISETASAAAPPVPVTAAAGVVPVVPCPLCLDDVVAETPLLECLSPASELVFCFLAFHLVGMAMRINAELLMFLAQKTEQMRG